LKTLTKYVCGEIILNFEIALATITSIFMFYEIGRYVQSVGTTMGLLQIIPFLLPSAMVLAFPLSILLGTLLTFSRLSSDNEIQAMYACRINFATILSPVFFLTFAIAILSLANTHWVVPWSFEKIVSIKNKTILDLVVHKMDTGDRYINKNLSVLKLKNDISNSLIIYRNEDGQTQEILANTFKIQPNYENASLQLILSDAHLSTINPKQTEKNNNFNGFSKNAIVNIKLPLDFQKRRITQRSFRELLITSNDKNAPKHNRIKSLFEIHRKIATAFSCIFLGILGMFIGLRMTTGNKFVGILLVMALVFMVYLPSISVGKLIVADVRLQIEPWIGAWLPFFVVGTMTIFLRPK